MNNTTQLKNFCEITLGEGQTIFSDIKIINLLIKEGQKRIDFNNLSEYCGLKKNRQFLMRKFKKVGFVPSFFVQNNMFFAINVLRYTSNKGRKKEILYCLPICSAYGKFKKFEILEDNKHISTQKK